MVIDLNQVDEFEQEVGREIAWERSRDFMLEYLSKVKTPLPPVARDGIAIAEQFRSGTMGLAELVSARVECWKYLDERSARTDSTTPAHCGVRAVICVLYDELGRGVDSIDLIDFFLEVASKFEDRSNEVDLLLRKYFGRSL